MHVTWRRIRREDNEEKGNTNKGEEKENVIEGNIGKGDCPLISPHYDVVLDT